MLTLTIKCDRLTNENLINDVLGLGGFSGMQTYNDLTGDCVLTLQTNEVASEMGFLAIVIRELHNQSILFTLTNSEA